MAWKSCNADLPPGQGAGPWHRKPRRSKEGRPCIRVASSAWAAILRSLTSMMRTEPFELTDSPIAPEHEAFLCQFREVLRKGQRASPAADAAAGS